MDVVTEAFLAMLQWLANCSIKMFCFKTIVNITLFKAHVYSGSMHASQHFKTQIYVILASYNAVLFC